MEKSYLWKLKRNILGQMGINELAMLNFLLHINAAKKIRAFTMGINLLCPSKDLKATLLSSMTPLGSLGVLGLLDDARRQWMTWLLSLEKPRFWLSHVWGGKGDENRKLKQWLLKETWKRSRSTSRNSGGCSSGSSSSCSCSCSSSSCSCSGSMYIVVLVDDIEFCGSCHTYP